MRKYKVVFVEEADVDDKDEESPIVEEHVEADNVEIVSLPKCVLYRFYNKSQLGEATVALFNEELVHHINSGPAT